MSQDFYLLKGEDRARIRANLDRYLDRLPPNRVFKVTVKQHVRKRSTKANARWWALLTAISQQAPAHMDGQWFHPEVWHEQVGDVVRSLKTIARDLDIPVIALSQVSRDVERRQNRRPGMADLSDSSEIEKEADQVITLYRDEVYDDQSMDKGVAELGIVKNRHGYVGTVRCAWAGEFVSFGNLSRGAA
jgi:replicative DNA helicase